MAYQKPNEEPKPIKGMMTMPEKPVGNGSMPMDMTGVMMPDSLRPKPKK